MGLFPVKTCFSVYCQFFVRSGKGPFFIPSLTIRFPERAQWGQGTETLANRRGRALPAIVLTTTPGGALHFVVAWRRVGSWVQVMDPECGRRWVRGSAFLQSLHQHGVAVAA